MALFNHKLEYTRIIDVVDSSECLMVNMSYDDAFGVRRNQIFTLDADKIDHIKIGGTASSHIQAYHSVVTNVLSNDKVEVILNDEIVECQSCEPMQFGNSVLVFEHMKHDAGLFGKFDFIVTKRHLENFRLNSIQVIACDKNDNHIKIIYIDPYVGCINDGGN